MAILQKIDLFLSISSSSFFLYKKFFWERCCCGCCCCNKQWFSKLYTHTHTHILLYVNNGATTTDYCFTTHTYTYLESKGGISNRGGNCNKHKNHSLSYPEFEFESWFSNHQYCKNYKLNFLKNITTRFIIYYLYSNLKIYGRLIFYIHFC